MRATAPSRGGCSRRALVAAVLAQAVLVAAAGATAVDHDAADRLDATAEPCGRRVDVVFWTGSDWQALAEALAGHASPCADYYVSVPPLAGDKTRLRSSAVYTRIRRLGPRVHPLAEVTLGQTGWAKWVTDGNGSWFDAGVEFRRRMAAAGLEPSRGETWLINEFDRTTRLDTTDRLPVEIARKVTRPYPRKAMLDLVRGLYEGESGQPLPGAAEIGINFSHQNLPDIPGYKREMKAWLEDAPFWAALKGRVRWLLHEVYADTRLHSVPGTGLDERRRHLEAYQQHLVALAEAGPPAIATARSFLRATHLPLANAGYVALGGDAFDFVTAHGNTEVSPTQMMYFVSEQVYAVREYELRHPSGRTRGRIGFSWDPINRFGVPAAEFRAKVAALSDRIAIAIRDVHRPGARSATGACVPPGGHRNWCLASRPDARFTEQWRTFRSWR